MPPRYEAILRVDHAVDHPAGRVDHTAGGVENRTPLRLAVAQPRCVALDVAANARAHAAAVRAARARVVVFPELSLTGYELDAPVVSVDDPLLVPLIEACAETGTWALVGAPVVGDHIAMLAVTGDGVSVAYRKMWLGDAEARRFRPGNAPAVLTVDGWRLGLAICKDTGVAAHAARTAALGIDGYVAGVLESARDAAVIDQRARRVATAHGSWVAVASFAGSTGGGYPEAAGRSGIWQPDGEVYARAGADPGGWITVSIG
ncbi:carbon-nitrogen hydrolase family protein [Micromonospora tarensis]|uniref:Carbon-nitrogen hydrolase family protein n=1 Tax=Micromonospora tarensis TaxID=2806100 RepID=A0ABS1YQP1_9ACTN|nr:carbon-nitrogen hydrolase family protein [Micromonospora tarensis]MBM0279643.1 carbon-nitrogen hydrolase family protein [Micromonospora tarensis]